MHLPPHVIQPTPSQPQRDTDRATRPDRFGRTLACATGHKVSPNSMIVLSGWTASLTNVTVNKTRPKEATLTYTPGSSPPNTFGTIAILASSAARGTR